MKKCDRTGSCACGRLKVTVRGGIDRTAICHCHACQRRTGSVFGVQFLVPKERFAVDGEHSTWRRVPEEGGFVDHRFCPNCGSTVFWEIDDYPDHVGVAVGAFAGVDPEYLDLPAPTFSVYRDHKHRWVEIPESVTEDWA